MQDGVAVVALDLTALGQNLQAEQWYAGLLNGVGQRLDIEDELEDFWDEHEHLGPLHRWMEALRQVALTHVDGPMVVFIDEIDVVQSLPFSTGEFFAAIRECYIRRPEDPELERLTFCLVGVATPAQLIDDPLTTPFNIGERVELRDFAAADAGRLGKGLPFEDDIAAAVVERVLHWTGGHPYLTQRVCQLASETGCSTTQEVDALVGEAFFSGSAREQEPNLQFVHSSMLGRDVDTAALLTMYGQILRRKRVDYDETNPLINVLRLSGLVRVDHQRLRVRNAIYARVFDQTWITENMPGAEMRRQRRAFWKGTLTTAALSLAALAIVGVSLLFALRSLDDAKIAEARLRTDNGIHLLQNGDGSGLLDIANALGATDDAGTRRLIKTQWAHWEAAYHGRLLDVLHFPVRLNSGMFTYDGAYFITTLADTPVLRWVETKTGWHQERTYSATEGHSSLVRWTETDARWVSEPFPADTVVEEFWLPAGGHVCLTRDADDRFVVWDITTLQPTVIFPEDTDRAALSTSGALVASVNEANAVSVMDTGSGEVVAGPWTYPATQEVLTCQFTADDRVVHIVVGVQVDGATTSVLVESRDTQSGALVRDAVRLQNAARFDDRLLAGGVWWWGVRAPDGRRYQLRRLDDLEEITAMRPYDNFLRAGGGRLRPGPYALPLGVGLSHRQNTPDTHEYVTGDGRVALSWPSRNERYRIEVGTHRGVVARSSEYLADTTIDVFSSDTGKAIGHLPLPGGMPQFTAAPPALSPDDSVLAATHRGAVQMWDVDERRQQRPPLPHARVVSEQGFRPGHTNQLVTVLNDGTTAYMWHATSDARLHAQRPIVSAPHAPEKSGAGRVVWSADGRHVATSHVERVGGGSSAYFRLWNWADDMPTEDAAFGTQFDVEWAFGFYAHGPAIAFSPDGKLFAFPDRRARKVSFWDIEKDAVTGLVDDMHGEFYLGTLGLAFTADGSQLALAGGLWKGGGGFLEFRDVATLTRVGEPMESGLGIDATFYSIALSPDGKWLVAGNPVGSTRAWPMGDLSKPSAIFGHDDWINKLAFSSDSRYLVTASTDATAGIWEVGSWTRAGKALQLQTRVVDAEFSPDDSLVVTSDDAGVVQLWDFATREAVGPAMRHEGPVWDTAFHPNGRWLATVSHAGWLRIWSVPQAPETNDSLQRQTWRTLGMRHDEESGEPRALTAAEWADVRNVGQR